MYVASALTFVFVSDSCEMAYLEGGKVHSPSRPPLKLDDGPCIVLSSLEAVMSVNSIQQWTFSNDLFAQVCVLGPPGGGTSSMASILFLAGGNLGMQDSLVFRDKSKISKTNAMKGFLSAYSTFEHKNGMTRNKKTTAKMRLYLCLCMFSFFRLVAVLNMNRNILHAMGHNELNNLGHFNSSIANLNSTQVSSFRENATDILSPLRAQGRPTVVADYRFSLTFGVWRPLLQVSLFSFPKQNIKKAACHGER